MVDLPTPELAQIVGFINDRSRLAKARRIVFSYVKVNSQISTDNLDIEDIQVVWFSKTLQNWKALLITALPDQMYYELTYNGDKKETYLDAYIKTDNVVFPDR